MNKLLGFNEENKKFYKTMIVLCIPIILQILITNAVNIMDTIMISSLGEKPVASIGIANQYFFLFLMLIGGLFSGCGMFIAQFFGKKDFDGIKKITALSQTIGLVLSIIFSIIAIFFPRFITNFFTQDKEVVDMCVGYLQIVGLSYPITCISYGFSTSSRSIRNPKLGMIASLIAIIFNAFFNYILIFGKFGAPALGVRGSAIATLIARIIEFSVIIWYVYIYKKDYAVKVFMKDLKRVNKNFINAFLSKSTSIIINDGTWALGTVMYSIAYSKVGTSAIAASQIATSVQNFFVIASVCMAIGSSIMIGNELGANNRERAIDYAKKFAVLIPCIGAIFGILLYFSIPILILVFSVPNHLVYSMEKIFLIMAFFMSLRAFNTFIIIGVLRSGGDTKYSLFLELGCMWLFSIPLTFICAYMGFPVYILVLASYGEELVKFIFGVPRAISKKWVKNIVSDM